MVPSYLPQSLLSIATLNATLAFSLPQIFNLLPINTLAGMLALRSPQSSFLPAALSTILALAILRVLSLLSSLSTTLYTFIFSHLSPSSHAELQLGLQLPSCLPIYTLSNLLAFSALLICLPTVTLGAILALRCYYVNTLHHGFRVLEGYPLHAEVPAPVRKDHFCLGAVMESSGSSAGVLPITKN